jgi:hypothetical protein
LCNRVPRYVASPAYPMPTTRLSRSRGGMGRSAGKVSGCFRARTWVRFEMIDGRWSDSAVFERSVADVEW